MKQNRSLELSLAILGILIALFAVKTCGIPEKQTTKVIRNTTILPAETVFVDRVKAKVFYRTITKYDTVRKTFRQVDTLYSTYPFTASIDTTIGCTRIGMEFNYPELCFNNIRFITCPDTVITYDTVTVMMDNKCLEYAGYGFLGGFILGSIIK